MKYSIDTLNAIKEQATTEANHYAEAISATNDHTAFSALWADALTHTDQDAYVSRWMLSSIWGDDPESDISQDHIDYLGRIWDVAHMSVREICKAAGLTQTALAQRFCIPYRTVQNWCGDVRKCPDYVRLMMARLLNLI